MTTTSTPTDTRAAFLKALNLGGSVVAAVRPEQLDHATPCGDYTVRDLLGHLLGVVRRVTVLGEGGDGMSVPAEITGVADDGWADAWQSGRDALVKAWSGDAALARTYRFPWATHDGAGTLAMYTSELTTHTWDLATATGQRPAWDDDVLAVAFASIQADLPGESRVEMFEAIRATMPPELRNFSYPYAERVPVADDAPLIDKLVAWTGRQP